MESRPRRDFDDLVADPKGRAVLALPEELAAALEDPVDRLVGRDLVVGIVDVSAEVALEGVELRRGDLGPGPLVGIFRVT